MKKAKKLEPFILLLPVIAFVFFVPNVTAEPVQALSEVSAKMAGRVHVKILQNHPPLGKNPEATAWYASLIFNNSKRAPIIEATDADVETWIKKASQPFDEKGEAVLEWSAGYTSIKTKYAETVLCPIGREHYFATDGERCVEHLLEGESNYFTVRGPQQGDPKIEDALWARPHANLLLYPLAWFKDFKMEIEETKDADGGFQLRGTAQNLEAMIHYAQIRTVPEKDSAVSEIRYLWRRPHGGTLLVEGLLSDHREIDGGILFPHHIVWTTQLIRKDQKTPDLKQPIVFDPNVHRRWTLDVVSVEYRTIEDMFPEAFLPAVPPEADFVDFRFSRGSQERGDQSYGDYRVH